MLLALVGSYCFINGGFKGVLLHSQQSDIREVSENIILSSKYGY
jgi:hypothetical protein